MPYSLSEEIKKPQQQDHLQSQVWNEKSMQQNY